MIDIEKEREWWDDNSDASAKALGYLDELEATRIRATELEVALSLRSAEERSLESEIRDLRAQLADQRERDIRTMAFHTYGLYPCEADLTVIARAYDRLAAIPVPAANEVES